MGLEMGVDQCRRRPDCARKLVYLDTSTFGELTARTPAAQRLADVLLEEIEAGRAICVGSPWHDDEISMLAWPDRHVKTLRTYTLELRMRFESELISHELHAAARQFSGQPDRITWKEAFRDDPDTPPLKPFQARYLNERTDRIEYAPAPREDVEHDRSTSLSLTTAHLELRAAGLEWEEIAWGNVDAQVKYLLGPLADPHFLEKAKARQVELVRHWMRSEDTGMEAGSPLRQYLRFAEITSTARALRENYPSVGADPGGFTASDAVRDLPTVRLFSFLLATLSVDGRSRKPSASDLHDLRHLTYGLSRCDVVTADRRMCALVRARGLVPDDVSLLEATRFDEIAEAVKRS